MCLCVHFGQLLSVDGISTVVLFLEGVVVLKRTVWYGC